MSGGDTPKRSGVNKFVWPPVQNAPGEMPTPESRRSDEPAPVVIESAAIPPASVDIAPVTPAAVPTHRWPAIASALREIETVWLGQVRAPFADRAFDAAWTPDPAGAYCPRCGIAVGDFEALDPDELGEGVGVRESGCPACRGKQLSWHRMIRLGEYTGLLRDVVLEIKYTRWRRLAHDAGALLGRQMTPHLSRAGLDARSAVIVPIPTPFWRRFVRGIDHTLAIARGVREGSGLRIVRALRRSHRPSQTSKAPTSRRANVANSMRAAPWFKTESLAGKTLILLDDVKTTGATMHEACRALRRALGDAAAVTPIWCALLAVTADPQRRSRRGVAEESARELSGAPSRRPEVG
ncbi:MAG: ComF family protein [Planctomycetes bacterium]|nr:ComF family protein [Planctomycetota bacterium]